MSAPNDYGNHPMLLIRRGIESANLEGAALTQGLAVKRFTRSVFEVNDGSDAVVGFYGATSSLTSMVANRACRDKTITKSMLESHGLPTAPGKRISSKDVSAARGFAKLHGWPVVIKPLGGEGGKGVTANIGSSRELSLAFTAADSGRGVLIEKHVSGEDYRFLVAGDEVLGVWRRDAANVVGDGRSSVSRLIDAKNAVRSRNPHVAKRPIRKDELVKNHLAKSGLDLDHVPTAGEQVYLRSAANLSSGGDNIEVSGETHQSLRELAVRAKRAIPGVELVGVDILLEDHRKPASEQSAHICEVNSLPGLSAHDYPVFGPPSGAGQRYLEILAEKCGLSLSPDKHRGTFTLTNYGQFASPRRFRKHIADTAQRAGLRVVASQHDDDKTVTVLAGDPWGVAVLNALSFVPRASVATVSYSTVEHGG